MSDSRYQELDVEESKRSFETTSSDMFLQPPRKPLLTIGWFNTRLVVLLSSIIIVISFLGALWHRPSFIYGSKPYRIAKVSMLYGNNKLYERALESHTRHGEKWGYPTYIKRQNEYCGYWNKPTFMIQQVAQELAKPERERAEWLMWVDADSIILNPNIPADIFLPPREFSHINIVAARDIQGLNTGIFFVRVHPWTISMFVDGMAFPLCNPRVELGNDADQAAMARTVEKSSGGPDGYGFKRGIVYLPRKMFNSYELPGYLRDGRTDVLRNFTGFVAPHAFEGQKGDFLVHLPGLFGDREPLMSDWLDMVENRQDDWAIPLEETTYLKDTQAFWKLYGEAVTTIKEALNRETIEKDMRDAVGQLRDALSEEADNSNRIIEYMNDLKKLLHPVILADE
ncbi:glycosyltransferase family 34 protein, partial [Aureobasidium melanogenum]